MHPLAGKIVALVHPAWHSCGSHAVFVSQARAYRALGATVLALAVDDNPAIRSRIQRERYFNVTEDLVAEVRDWSAMPLLNVLRPSFLRAGLKRLNGNYAALRLETAKRIPIPKGFSGAIDLIHCNHFFCMPVADRVRAGRKIPILLDSHDIQARQYALSNDDGYVLPPRVSFEDMLSIEIEQMDRADLLIHLNSEEAAFFANRLPDKNHLLLYPAVSSLPATEAPGPMLIVAAANRANVSSIEWFLREILPLAPQSDVKIIGSVDVDLRKRNPDLFSRYANLFTGRVDQLASYYKKATAILLPTTAGHGISIKTIEALSCGAPLVATSHAFRGMQINAASLAGVTLADDPVTFARAMQMATRPRASHAKGQSATQEIYERMFSPLAYQKSLEKAVRPLLDPSEKATI